MLTTPPLAVPAQSRLRLSRAALVANWQAFARAAAPAECAAAIKADGYGLGARAVLETLAAASCRRFYVAHWAEVAALLPLPDGVQLGVLHGVLPHEMPVALALPATPVLATPAQLAAWAGTGRPLEVMVDTGLNRLGLPADAAAGLLAGHDVAVLHSHLACAEDKAHPLNAVQQQRFAALAAAIPAGAHALANSGGVGLGQDWHFSMVRPGIGLFGGLLLPDGNHAHAVASLEARVLEVRAVPAGATVGYGATFTARRDSRIATVGLGYADGFPRPLGGQAVARAGGVACPAAGRVSMDMTAFDVTDADVAEGDWLAIDFDLATISAQTGRTEYEVLTGLGRRFERVWA